MTDKMTAEQAITELAAFHVNSESGLHLLSVIRQALSAPRVPDIASMIDGFDDTEFVRRHGNSIRQCLAVVNDMDLQELRDLVVGYWGVANKLLAASPEPVAQDAGALTNEGARGIPAENIMHDLDAALVRIMYGTDEDSDVTFIRSAFKAWAGSAAAERRLRAEVEALKAKLVEWAGEAYDDVGSWAAYVEQYFQNKHGLSDDLDKWAARLREGGGE